MFLTDEKLKAYLLSHPCVLDEFVREYVSTETIERWLATRKGESRVQTVKLQINRLERKWVTITMEAFRPPDNILF